MIKISNFLSKNLPLLIILVGAGTYVSPIYWKTASWVPSLLLGVVIFFTGLSMNIDEIKGIRSKRKELVLAALLKWTITVFVSIGLAFVFFQSNHEIAAGIILSGTVPSATAATLYTFLAGGNTSLVIASSLIDVGISPIVTPLSMLGLSGSSITISFLDLLKSFLLIVVIPMSTGLAVKQFFPKMAAHSKDMTRFGSSLSLLLIIHTIVGNGTEAISQHISFIPLIILATFIQVVLPMFAAYVIAKKCSVAKEDARAILFQVGLCNTALAAILAFQFISELAAIAPIINMIINLSVGSYISNQFSAKGKIQALKIETGRH